MALDRVAEPELIMETPDAVDEFHWAGGPGGPLFASYQVLVEHLAPTLPEGATVVDVCCGSGRLLTHLLAGRPDLRGVGVDLSERMLSVAARGLADAGLAEQVTLVRSDAAETDRVVAEPVAAVVSTSALHHCPTRDDLVAVLGSVARLHQRDGAAVWLFDLVRPEQEALLERIPRGYELVSGARLPAAFRADWITSLHAGWTVDEMRDAAAEAGLDLISASADHSQLHRVAPASPVSGPPWNGPEPAPDDRRRTERLAAALGLT
jgi:cyclopropane fatty-acyl-phospholipid synthase-like methyltransferase